MVARLASAGIGLPLLGVAVWFGSPWLTALAALVAALGAAEFSRLVSQSRVSPILLSAPWAVALVLGGHAGAEFILPVLGGGLLVSLVLPLLRKERSHALTDWALTVAGALYLGLPLSFAVLLRGLEHGRYWLLFVLLATFATDTGAYFIGRLAGRHRLAPTISPNKTWEGAVGGFTAAVGAAVAMSLLFPLPVEAVDWRTLRGRHRHHRPAWGPRPVHAETVRRGQGCRVAHPGATAASWTASIALPSRWCSCII